MARRRLPDEDAAVPEAKTVAGIVRGRWESDVAVFRGIPYAVPPLPFTVPQPVAPWDGVRSAASFGPSTEASDRGPDDECLTVNVWTPDPGPAAKLPVMVWIHGGGYEIGSSSRPEYDGGRLANDGEIVVVTLNYRLAAEGFGSAPANLGLLDQVAALEWVRDNVTAFGGDPGRVTIFGESAGGGCVAALLAMPRAAGLFHAAIAQSMPGTFFAPELAARIAADPADSSVDSPGPLRGGPAAYPTMRFAPVVDGDVLPCTPWQALAAGAARDIPLIVGHTRDEHRLFTVINGGHPGTDLDLLAPGGVERYRAAFPDATDARLNELIHSDWLFRMPSVHLADARLAGGGRAFLYELTWSGLLGACHGLDVPLVFGTLTGNEPAQLLGDNPGAAAVSTQMRSAWTRFATTGDPGWPAYTPEEQLTQIFDEPSVVAPYPEEASYGLWRDHVFAALTT
ncbi:carboxylesterase/lipase family protein [Paractinoplanes lichenicola]|uniref:Carboxylic ester hydrolase n=1 Tax=Paractinoplanes lichenicola TaxID=2802976 RepID=A0ABS1VDX7_9ACTN|nr:carboxylesterase family protein [Actinoplanes lichenicola]MBL7252830.1 carboxylesterase/lipase family protein [Actinoplanes lichenicola]